MTPFRASHHHHPFEMLVFESLSSSLAVSKSQDGVSVYLRSVTWNQVYFNTKVERSYREFDLMLKEKKEKEKAIPMGPEDTPEDTVSLCPICVLQTLGK